MTTQFVLPARAGLTSIAFACLALATACALLAHVGPLPLALFAVLTPAFVAAGVDWRDGRVPDRLVAATLVAAFGVAVVVGPSAIESMGFGVLLMAAPLLMLHVARPAMMAFGDVKLAAALGAVLGLRRPELVLPALASASLITLAWAAARRVSSRPFAPGLVLGTALAVTCGAHLGWEAV